MEIVKENKPVYSPEKKYSWKGNDEFVINGAELNFILNSVRKILLSDQAQNIFMLEKANSMLEGIMSKAVADGKIKEVEETKAP